MIRRRCSVVSVPSLLMSKRVVSTSQSQPLIALVLLCVPVLGELEDDRLLRLTAASMHA